MPGISIVIPTCNRAHLLTRAVKSVLSQGVAGIETVIVDDGSTDGTEQVCMGIGDPRVRYFAQANRGANAARNIGAKLATSELLTFLDSDDEALPGWLPAVLDAFGGGADVVTCGFLLTTPQGEERVLLPRDMGPAFDHTVATFSHAGTYALRRRHFLEIGGFGEAVLAAQHTEFAYRLVPHALEHGWRIESVMRPLIRYNAGARDGIRSDNARVLAGGRYLVDHHERRLRRDPPRYAKHCSVVAVRAARLRQLPLARVYFWKAARADWRRPRNWGRLAVSYLPPVAKRVWPSGDSYRLEGDHVR